MFKAASPDRLHPQDSLLIRPLHCGTQVPVETWTLNAVYLGKAAMTPVWTR